MEPVLLRVDEAAKYLAIGRSTLYALIARGDVPTVHIGRAVRIRAATLRQFIQELSNASPWPLDGAGQPTRSHRAGGWRLPACPTCPTRP